MVVCLHSVRSSATTVMDLIYSFAVSAERLLYIIHRKEYIGVSYVPLVLILLRLQVVICRLYLIISCMPHISIHDTILRRYHSSRKNERFYDELYTSIVFLLVKYIHVTPIESNIIIYFFCQYFQAIIGSCYLPECRLP